MKTKYLNIYKSNNNLSSVNSRSNTETFVQEYAVRLNKDNMILASSGSQETTGWDDTGDVEGNIRMYYSKDGNMYKITRVTGSWLIHQSGTAIKNRKVMVVCNEGFFTDQRIDKSISTASFDVSTRFTRYADSTQGLVGIGSKSVCTIYRTSSGSSWTLEIDNMIAGSIPSIS